MICPLSHLEDAEHTVQYTTKDDLKKMCLKPTPKDLCSTLAVRMRQQAGRYRCAACRFRSPFLLLALGAAFAKFIKYISLYDLHNPTVNFHLPIRIENDSLMCVLNSSILALCRVE